MQQTETIKTEQNKIKSKRFLSFIDRRLPVGYSVNKEFKAFLLCLICGIAPGLTYATRYWNAHTKLYTYVSAAKTRVLIHGAVMPDFISLLGDCMNSFLIMALTCLIIQVISHYRYHRQGANTFYTMRRLPDRSEYARRCWSMAVLEAIAILLAMIIMFFIHFLTYILCTPDACLTPGQWDMILDQLIKF